MVDINREAWVYASRHPYKFTRVRLPDTQRNVEYRMRITEQPDPMIAAMLGDFVHNLRSALDHIIVASVPRQRQKSAGFPILFEDIWATDKDGNFVVNDTERRENIETTIKGLHPKARALVIGLQPYHRGPDTYRNILGIISPLENADKHRQLITVGGGVQNLIGTFTVRNSPAGARTDFILGHTFAQDDTIVGWEAPANRTAPDGTILKPSEVGLEFTGTAKILVKITRLGGNEPPSNFALRRTMLDAIGEVRRILRLMEPVVRR